MIKIITSLVAVLTISSVKAQVNVPETPKLVIGITIDQLRGDYLDFFQSNFGEKGFKRLLREGLVYQNMSFDFPDVNGASAISTIYTGSDPFYSGINSSQKYLRDKGVLAPVFADDSYLGNYTQDKVSPLALKVSTIGDELKIASQGNSDVYSFAPNSTEALITAGRAGNGAYWLEDFTGKWATTTYYKNLHWVVDQYNRSNSSLSRRISELNWKPLLSIDKYKSFPYTNNIYNFNHSFGANKDSYILLKESPLVNDETVGMALSVIDKAALGKRTYPDFVSLALYAGNYSKAKDKNYSVELQDTYCRLDKQLGDFLDGIDKLVGLKNTIIFITSTGYYQSEEPQGSNLSIPNSVFYPNRCTSLLNMYLMATYGREQWVEGFYNNQIYLNRKLIENKNLNLKEVQKKAAEFVIQFTGVQDVATSSQLLFGEENSSMSGYRNLLNRDTAGDIILVLQPGVKIVNEKETTANVKDYRIRNTEVVAPVFFFGYNVKPQKINRTIDAKEIAPTISYILRIRSPNASNGRVLSELIKY